MQKLKSHAKTHNLYPLYVQIRLIECQLLQVKAKFDLSRKEIEEILEFTRENNLQHLENLVLGLEEKMEEKYTSILKMVERNQTMAEIVKKSTIREYIRKAQNYLNV